MNVNGENITGWRLPATVDGPEIFSYDGSTPWGYNNTTSEMGHLYYTELGNQGMYDTSGNGPRPQSVYGLRNTGVFNNLVIDWYWSGTAASPYNAWLFLAGSGGQMAYDKNNNNRALAVLPGQISSVPAPATLLLMGSGLAGLLGVRRKKK